MYGWRPADRVAHCSVCTVLHLLAVVARPILRRTLILFVRFKDLKRKERKKNQKNRNVSGVLGILVLECLCHYYAIQ